MFGYVTIFENTLDKDERARYQSIYCGLCQRLGHEYGGAGRMTLTYDMAFLSMLLSSVYDLAEDTQTLRCPVNPLRKCDCVFTEATDYAADLNLLLAYYKQDDDWRDDHSVVALGRRRLLQKNAEKAAGRWPQQAQAIREGLEALTEMERAGELNPDLPANCFGAMMGALFAWRAEGEWTPTLVQMGAALGRFIYLMDAMMDLRADIRHQRYNPLVSQVSVDIVPMLTVLIGECTTLFETLPIHRDVRILRNILYSGVWAKYQTRQEGQGKRQ